MNEGDRVNFTITTQNVPKGTKIFISDMYENSTNFLDDYSKNYETAVNSDGEEKVYFKVNSKGKIKFWDKWNEDGITEGTDSYYYKIYSDSDHTDLLATSESIEIIDTSQAPPLPNIRTNTGTNTGTNSKICFNT